MRSIRLTAEEAAAALRAAAKDGKIGEIVETKDGVRVNSTNVEDAIDEFPYAKIFSFEPNSPFGHDLAVVVWDIVHRFDVPYPNTDRVDRAGIALALLESDGGYLLRVLQREAERCRTTKDPETRGLDPDDEGMAEAVATAITYLMKP